LAKKASGMAAGDDHGKLRHPQEMHGFRGLEERKMERLWGAGWQGRGFRNDRSRGPENGLRPGCWRGRWRKWIR
jgi:hypothetical protein